MDRRGFIRTGFAAGAAGLVLPFLDGRGSEAARGKPLTVAERAADPYIRLNSNENALGIAPSARQAVIDAISGANRYPFAGAGTLAKQLADHHKVPEGSITLGCGSAEILQMTVQAFAAEDSLLLTADPTFEAPSDYARAAGVRVEKFPLAPDFSHDISSMRNAAERHGGPVLVYICNPNNPTGTVTACRAIEEWIAAAPDRVTFLIDEAYVQFVKDQGFWSMTGLAAKRHNVIVARTFSKVYAMAGMRMGYAVSTENTARKLALLSTGLSVNHLALTAASASLNDGDFLKESLAATDRSRKILLDALDELKIGHLPSEANFVMFKLKGTISEFDREMAARQILVGRPFPPMLDHCRVTLGLESEMKTFAAVLKEFTAKGWV